MTDRCKKPRCNNPVGYQENGYCYDCNYAGVPELIARAEAAEKRVKEDAALFAGMTVKCADARAERDQLRTVVAKLVAMLRLASRYLDQAHMRETYAAIEAAIAEAERLTVSAAPVPSSDKADTVPSQPVKD